MLQVFFLDSMYYFLITDVVKVSKMATIPFKLSVIQGTKAM